MKTNKSTFRVLALVVTLAATLSAQSVDEIIEKNIEAKGGRQNWEAVDSMKASGKLVMQGGMVEAPMEIVQTRPDKIRIDIDAGGMEMLQAYDGEQAWMIAPPRAGGTGAPQEMPAKQAEAFKESADFDGPLMDYKEKGHAAELIGEEDLEGTPVYHLKLTRKSGKEMHFYLDKETGLELKMVSTEYVPQMGGDMEMHRYFDDFKQVGPLMIPHSIETKARGQTFFHIVLEDVALDPEVDKSMFSMPEAGDEN